MRISECGMRSTLFRTPFGWAGVAASAQGICGVVLPKKDKKTGKRELDAFSCSSPHPPQSPFFRGEDSGFPPLAKGGKGGVERTLQKTVKLLQKYFSGKRVSFDLPLDISYYTPFQQAVWRAAEEIAYGETRSYASIAKRIKNPKAVRAVGRRWERIPSRSSSPDTG
jgi:O6-methylguanine-DNA--protein-cysteine methyltransferase